MKTRFAAALFALALPLCAQAPVSAETEAIFYKAFYLEKGPRDFAAAMALYDEFLAKAPEHKLAKEAATQQFALLDRLGKSKERDAFREKHAKLLGNVQPAPRGERPADADRPAGERPAGAGRMDPAARLADLEKQLAKAKEEGDEEAQKRIAQQIERTKQMAAGGGRAGGQGGQGGQGRGMRGGPFGAGKPLAEMNDEEMTQFKDGLERMAPMMDRMKERMDEEQVKKLDANLESLKKNLEAGKLEDAQKALDAIRASFPRRGGGGGN